MYSKAIKKTFMGSYSCAKEQLAGFLRFEYPHDHQAPRIVTNFPGPNHLAAIQSA
jgi:adenosylmethionine-8-amino-7-oxononanoate aminotransferase